MKLWLFRSNLRPLESYHSINDLETFKKECHDFYLLQLIWYLENDYLEEAVVWRLKPTDNKFENKRWRFKNHKHKEVAFTQLWINDFSDVYIGGGIADISFFRGGFKEYDKLTKHKYSHLLGTKLYLGAGQRTYPQYGGQYDKILIEEETTIRKNTVPFYKTASPNIFYPRVPVGDIIYDICYISNFSQLSYKGQEKFIKQVSDSKYLQSLKIVHLGNNPEIGTQLCNKYNVYNIEFKGWVDRWKANDILNESKFGLVYSNKTDGTPRVITEILSTGTPLFISDQTRVLDYYRCPGVISFNDVDFERCVRIGLEAYTEIKEQAMKSKRLFAMDLICKRNWKNWAKKNVCSSY